VLAQLRQCHPDHSFERCIIRTEGDEVTTVPLSQFGSRGVFVKEIQAALLSGHIDLAVHSLKDLPSQSGDALSIVAISEREDVRDVLISRHNLPLAQLPIGALIGTSSPRRAAQIKAFRPDLSTADLRGNLDTRLRKAERGDYDGVVLAAAGIHRLGLRSRITEYLSIEISVPAVGQGALAIECRQDDRAIAILAAVLDHAPTHRAITAERSYMHKLGGGCQAPAGAFAAETDGVLTITGAVVSLDGSLALRARLQGPPEAASALGEALAEDLLRQGAGAILDAARGV
jgi:hydroxymethylbilane synthase